MINIHSVLPRSEINGPGARMVVFFQGCNRGCPGCFNPQTHSQNSNKAMTAAGIFSGYFKVPGPSSGAAVEGLTVSGGEPFLQPEGLCELLKTAKIEYGLTNVVYTGYLMDELLVRDGTEEILGYVDVLIDGPFKNEYKESSLLARGSTNQTLHLLSKRYREEDFLMKGKIEIIISKDGAITRTGFSCAD